MGADYDMPGGEVARMEYRDGMDGRCMIHVHKDRIVDLLCQCLEAYEDPKTGRSGTAILFDVKTSTYPEARYEMGRMLRPIVEAWREKHRQGGGE